MLTNKIQRISRRKSIRPMRAGAVLVATAALVTLAISPVSAHVSVSSTDAVQGGGGTVVLQVPNESDSAKTTKIVVTIPSETPLASVDYQPVPGWTTTTTKVKLATPLTTDDGTITEGVSAVTWTADNAGGLAHDQFQRFTLAVFPLPKTDSISFPTTQTYSDGRVVQWNEPALASGGEAEHPVPTLQIAADEASAGMPGMAAASSSTTSSTLSKVALGVGVVALLLAGIALMATRKQKAE